MTQRTYPYKAWVLQPSFKPVEVELTQKSYPWSSTDYGDETAKGKSYRTSELHPSKDAAIAAGWIAVERIQADLDKRNETLRKKRAALNKAAEWTT